MPPHSPARFPADDVAGPAVPPGDALHPDVLAELPAEMAFAVWQVLRCVTLWTGQAEPRRAGLFHPEYMREWEGRLLTGPLDADARFPLAVIVGELAGPNPGGGRLSWACVCVADWALGRGAYHAALAFAEAAARAAPHHPRYAWLVGRMMRSHGDPRGAARWLKRALKLAVAQRDRETQARTLTSLGNLSYETGRYPEARELHTRALKVSRRWRLREQEGMALHDLFVIATEEGNRAEAEGHARGALAAYGEANARVAKLAHDVAYSWMLQGHCERSLTVLHALRPQFTRPDDELRVVATIARAAGGLGDRAQFERAREDAEALLPRLVTREALAPSLLEIAHGAAALGDARAATATARAAIEAATLRGEADVRVRAEALLRAVAAAPAPARVMAEERSAAARARAERLAEELVGALHRAMAAAPPAWNGDGEAEAGADGEVPPPAPVA